MNSYRLILRCEDNLEGIFTALYDAFVYKKKIEPYEDNIAIEVGFEGNLSLFAEERIIHTDSNKVRKTAYAISNKLGYSVYDTVFYALCHYDKERANAVLGYLVRAFATGSRIREYMADPYVMRVLELSRKVSNEYQRFCGFLRFRDVGDFLFSQIEPKCDLLPLLVEHFTDRYPNEHFVIYDAIRKYALIHPAFRSCVFVSGDEAEKFAEFQETSSANDTFEQLWKVYFGCMSIDERANQSCQRNMLPIWYRKNMLEHQS